MDKSKFTNMPITEIVNHLSNEFHVPLQKLIEKIADAIIWFSEKYRKEYPKIVYLKELYNQFRSEVAKHIEKEDEIMFPMVIDYENNKLNFSEKNKQKIDSVDFHKMEGEHSIFQNYLDTVIDLLGTCKINDKNSEECNEVRQDFIDINEDLQEHVYLEEVYIYKTWQEIERKANEDK